MRQTPQLMLCLGMALLCLPVIAGQAQAPALCSEMRSIENYGHRLERLLRKPAQRTFGRPFRGEPEWIEIDRRHSGEFDGIVAHVYFRRSIPIVVVFAISSESGDWAQDVTFYFRDDGTLARRTNLLRTFFGEAEVTSETFYDCAGQVLSPHGKHLDLKTKLPKVPDSNFIDEPPPEYKRTGDLPFFPLLQRPMTQATR